MRARMRNRRTVPSLSRHVRSPAVPAVGHGTWCWGGATQSAPRARGAKEKKERERATNTPPSCQKKKRGMASLALPRPGLLARLATALEEGVLMMGERDGLVRVGAEIESWPVEKKKKLDLPPSSPPLSSLPPSLPHSLRPPRPAHPRRQAVSRLQRRDPAQARPRHGVVVGGGGRGRRAARPRAAAAGRQADAAASVEGERERERVDVCVNRWSEHCVCKQRGAKIKDAK